MYTITATSSFGLEAIVARELRNLGYHDLKVENGRVSFAGNAKDVARCNIWLRCADRVFITVNTFQALDFEELYQGTLAVPWEDIIPGDGKMHIVGKSVKSKLFSVPDCQSIVKKAVVKSMQRKYDSDWFSEDGPVFKIEISLLKDMATLSIDTSGAGLHKRGYRLAKGEAPLRETLAAALVYISRWNPDRVMADPLCGSGTIAIEAALLGRNIAPGLKRSFASEEWPNMERKIWDELREEAHDLINDKQFQVLASDIDKSVFKKARQNAIDAGVEENILFQKKPVAEFSSKNRGGCIVTNPPYGSRLSDMAAAEETYRHLGELYEHLDSWSFFILTSHPDFEKHFAMKSSKNRKLYNGKIKVHLYQYFREK